VLIPSEMLKNVSNFILLFVGFLIQKKFNALNSRALKLFRTVVSPAPTIKSSIGLKGNVQNEKFESSDLFNHCSYLYGFGFYHRLAFYHSCRDNPFLKSKRTA